MPDVLRGRLRRIWLGLVTVLGLGQAGFFIPYRYACSVVPQGYPALEPLFARAEPVFVKVLAAINSHTQDFVGMSGQQHGPRFTQEWFPRLDACAAYALVRLQQPARIIEIGSGHSTRFLAQAVADGALATHITCIDPAPRADIALIGVTHLAKVLADVDATIFGSLAAGDILFVDSSHIAMPGSDVDRLVLDIVPRLAPGVLVHFHDVVLPDAYPAALAQWGYNEQGMVGALLLGGAMELVFSSHYVATRMAELLRANVVAHLPLAPDAIEGSIWLRKC